MAGLQVVGVVAVKHVPPHFRPSNQAWAGYLGFHDSCLAGGSVLAVAEDLGSLSTDLEEACAHWQE